MTYAEAALLQPGDHVILESKDNMLKYGYCVMPDMTLHAGEEVIVRHCWDKDEIDRWTGEVLATHRAFYFRDLWGNDMSFFYSEGTIARAVDLNMNKYKRVINEIAGMLEYAGIPCTVNDISDGAQVRFPWNEGDIACHHGIYKADDGFVESLGLPWNEGSVTTLMPEDAVARIIELYNQYKGTVATEEDLLDLLELS